MDGTVMKVIGNYTYNPRDCLGEGVFGKVFEGCDRDTRQKVAIKKVDISSYSHDKYLETSIFYEIFLLKNLKHPNIVRFKDVLTTKNSLYIVTQFCKHGDLKEALKRKKYREDEALDVVRQIISGFSELVREHIIHRDLKPANIMISDGVYKIGDFGFAKYVDNMGNHMLRSCVGSPIYMAPQLLEHSTYTTKADIWSIGIISYEIIFGSPPWKARNEAELLQNIRTVPLTSIIRNQPIKVSASTVQFLKRVLAYHQKDRISWEELFALFKIEHSSKPVIQEVPQKNRQLPIVSSTNMVTNRSNSLVEFPYKSRNSSLNEFSHQKHVPVHPNSSIGQFTQQKSTPPVHPNSTLNQPAANYSKMPPHLTHRSSLLTIEQIKRLRDQCVYKHFVEVELQSNYAFLESVIGQAKRIDRMLLLLAGSAKLKSTYAVSGLYARNQSSPSRGNLDEFCRAFERQKQSYQMAQKQITRLLEKQGTLKSLKQEISSTLSAVQGGEGRILKAEELLLQSASEVARILYHQLKRKIQMFIDAFSLVRMLDYILDIISLSTSKDSEYLPLTELLIAPTRVDEFDPFQYFNKVAIRAQQLIVLNY